MDELDVRRYEMFRCGPDPYFIGYGALLLIPEIIGLSIAGISNDSVFARIPYWLLTCMVVTMLASLITGIAFVNNKSDGKKFEISPLLSVASKIGLVYTIWHQ